MASPGDMAAKLADLARLKQQAERLLAGASAPRRVQTVDELRAADRARKADKLRRGKCLFIPEPKDPLRRTQLEADGLEWLRFYLAHIFVDPFQEHHLIMINAIDDAVVYGGDQAIAAPRGEAKSTLCECVVLKNVLRGLLSFGVLFAATGGDSENSLGSIKEYIVASEPLADDYPELCIPVQDVFASPQRAASCWAEGEYGGGFPPTSIKFQWSGKEIILPDVPNSPFARAIIATRGLDSAVRGLKKGTRRPTLAVIDDPDTEDTAASPDQAKKLERRIDRAIAGLSGRGARMARVMLTTLQNRRCVSARYTDPQQKPSWNGKRLAFLITPPDRKDLWDEYVALRQSDQQEGDSDARKAHAWLLERFDIMHAGAVLANPLSYDHRTLRDGSQKQVSALQRYYDFVADNGLEAALSELQSDPAEETRVQESLVTASRVQCQVSGFPRGRIPPGCTVLTQGIDVKKDSCHWIVRAWRPNPGDYATGFTIAYGISEVHGTERGSDVGVDAAIVKALHVRREEMDQSPYAFEDGEILEPQLTLIDSKWRKEAIFRFCEEAGLGFYPAVGYGRSSGTIAPNFRDSGGSDKKVMGWQCYSALRSDGGWMVHINADHYKAWEHDRWLSDPRVPGALLLYGQPGRGTHRSEQSDDQRGHLAYAHHICAEKEVEEPVHGIMKRFWKTKSDNNHWLDASYRASCAAGMCGIRLVGMPAPHLVPADEVPPPLTMPDGSPYLASER